jgi:phage recombination protein Bet
MNNIVAMKPNIDWTPAQLKLIRHTVAKDCNAEEFDLFIHTARAVGLDPLRKQIYAQVYNKDKPDKRQLTIITAIGGYRSIAERTGNYRPDDQASRYTMCAPDPAFNPLGIEKAEVTVYKFSHGAWHAVVGEAWWSEYVPLNWEKTGIDTKKTGWVKMPRIMIAKCAEAAALRKAWPDDFAGLNIEEEMDRTHSLLDLTASEVVDAADAEYKLNMIGGKDALTVDWIGGPLARVPDGKFVDESMKWMHADGRKLDDLRHWWERNLAARSEFKARHGSDYHELQRAYEQRLTQLATAAPASAGASPPEERSQAAPPPAAPLLNDKEAKAALKRLDGDIAACASNPDLLALEQRWLAHLDKLPVWAAAEAKEKLAKAKAV